ncbi:MAG: cysteine--tRNA ligase [Clostridiales bacterium]|nr:cysteine--tRNA ligase [Clostridiales bacterium]
MKLYNTLTRQKEEFVPITPGKVTMYACGPTVYNFFHIGNARCFVVFDMLRRYLEFRGYDVTFVQNFTDVDDKMIKRANEEHQTVKQIADRYINEYFTDAKGLGIRPATIHPRATEHIEQIIALISRLIENGYAYQSGGDVYYATKQFHDYGKLSHMPIDDLEAGARIDVTEQKRDPLDFALWKAEKPGEPSWDSPWGKGRPGWHIECSAMSSCYLGKTIDIHCGGQDLCFPHHENEIAQSEGAWGQPFVHYWVHNGYINVDNQKMSKSLNNFFTVRDVAQTYGYDAIRFFLLSSHYRSPINYSAEVLQQAKQALQRIRTCEDNLSFYLQNVSDESQNEAQTAEQCAKLDAERQAFIDAMDDDFNTADGIAHIFEMVRQINQMIAHACDKQAAQYAQERLKELVDLMGLGKQELAESSEDQSFVQEIEAAIAQRAEAKKAKDYARADAIRASLLEKGVTLEDTAQGTKYTIHRNKES